MVPGTRPKTKEKAATMANQPPRTPIRFTRATAAMRCPGANPNPTQGRPPPKPRQNLPIRNTQTATTVRSPRRFNRTTTAMSSPIPNPMPSSTTPSAELSQQPTPTAELSPQPTPTASVSQTIPVDISPGARSSRQSNDINEPADQFEVASSEGHTADGQPDHDLVLGNAVPRKNVRKKTMGHGLEKMLNRGNKMPIEVAAGKKRPQVPLQAVKLTSECGVALRDNLPIYSSWKKYDNEQGRAEVGKVLRRVALRLDVDVMNEGPSLDACTDIIKKGVRQQRYHLKRKYFDESLTREQLLAKEPPPKMNQEEWTELVEYWCDPKNQEKCTRNKVNRAQVQLIQRTGSRSYVAHRYSLRHKYNNQEPDPVDFFGECMNSPLHGRTPLANDIYASYIDIRYMHENMVAEKERQLEEGEPQKSPAKIVAESLSQISRSSAFLPNIGVARVSKTAVFISSCRSAFASSVPGNTPS